MTERKPYGPPYPTRIEPDLGVPVLTHLGFLAKEADHNGTTIEEEAESEAEFFKQVEDEFLDEWRDPSRLLAWTRDYARNFNRDQVGYLARNPQYREGKEDFIPVPRRILEVVEVEGGCTMRGHKVRVKALALREHGRRDYLYVTDWFEHGASYYDPPDGESEMWWESDLGGWPEKAR